MIRGIVYTHECTVSDVWTQGKSYTNINIEILQLIMQNDQLSVYNHFSELHIFLKVNIILLLLYMYVFVHYSIFIYINIIYEKPIFKKYIYIYNFLNLWLFKITLHILCIHIFF